MKRIRRATACICAALFVGCEDDPRGGQELRDANMPTAAAPETTADAAVQATTGADAPPPVDAEAGSGDERPEPSPACLDLAAVRQRVLARIQSSACSDASCQLIEVEAQPGQATERSVGRRILLIDDGITAAAATRYKSRVLAYLRRRVDGSYEAFQPRVTISHDAYELLTELDAFARQPTAAQLDVAADYFTKFPTAQPEASELGHGMDIFPFLADAIPDSQFVVSEDQLSSSLDCALLSDDQAAFANLEQTLRRTRETLLSVIAQYGISAVHLSWGLDHLSLAEAARHACQADIRHETSSRIMRAYATLFTALTSAPVSTDTTGNERVVLFQAGATSHLPDGSRDSLDCHPIPGRVRVSHVAYAGSAVPAEGSYDRSLLPPLGSGRTFDCNDVFVVMGFESTFKEPRAGAFFGHQPYGLGVTSPVWPAAPSFANPIALAHYFHLREQQPELTRAQLIEKLTRGGSKPILDPLLHKQLPMSRVHLCP